MKQTRLTDDFGCANLKQYRVIEQVGSWFLLYNQHQWGTLCNMNLESKN